MENETHPAGTIPAEESWTEALEPRESWTAHPDPGHKLPGTKMDWIQGLPFKSERGAEVLPPDTVNFYRGLR
jgi:hypothetical protein